MGSAVRVRETLIFITTTRLHARHGGLKFDYLFAQGYIKENTNALHYWSFVMRFLRSPVDFPRKWSEMVLCHNVTLSSKLITFAVLVTCWWENKRLRLQGGQRRRISIQLGWKFFNKLDNYLMITRETVCAWTITFFCEYRYGIFAEPIMYKSNFDEG